MTQSHPMNVRRLNLASVSVGRSSTDVVLSMCSAIYLMTQSHPMNVRRPNLESISLGRSSSGVVLSMYSAIYPMTQSHPVNEWGYIFLFNFGKTISDES